MALLRNAFLLTLAIFLSVVHVQADSQKSESQFPIVPYPTPPFVSTTNSILQITIETTPEAIRALTPGILTANPYNEVILEIGSYNPGIEFNSVSLYVPVSYGDMEGKYVAAIYIDYDSVFPSMPNDMQSDQSGFIADISFLRYDEHIQASVGEGDRSFIEATMDIEPQKNPCASNPTNVLFYLNKKSVGEETLLQLMQTELGDYAVKQRNIGTATLRMDDIPFYQFGDIPVLRVVKAVLKTESAMPGEETVLSTYPERVALPPQDQESEIPENTMMVSQNYPNPFNPTTVFSYTIPASEYVKVRIYNTLGEVVTTLVDQVQPEGEHIVSWNGRNDFQQEVSSGQYFYQISAGNQVQTKQMFKLK